VREDGPCIARPVVHTGDRVLIVTNSQDGMRGLPCLVEEIRYNAAQFPLAIGLNTPAHGCYKAKWNPYRGRYETWLGTCPVVLDTSRNRATYRPIVPGNQLREHDLLKGSTRYRTLLEWRLAEDERQAKWRAELEERARAEEEVQA
jgi:hypothetical protein